MAMSSVFVLATMFFLGVIPMYISMGILGDKTNPWRVMAIKLAITVVAVILFILTGFLGVVLLALLQILIYKVLFGFSYSVALAVWFVEVVVVIGVAVLFSILGVFSIKEFLAG